MQKQIPLGFLIALGHRRIKQAVTARVADLRLTPQQFWTLVHLLRHEGESLGDLAAHARMDEPTASRVVYTLSRRGLVRSRVDPADRRRLRLTMTAQGRSLGERLMPIADEIRGAVDGALPPAEREAVAAGLQQVIERLERMHTAAAPRVIAAGLPEASVEGRAR